MVKFEDVKAGDVLYDVHNQPLGGPKRAPWVVKVISVDPEKKTAVVSYNGQKPGTVSQFFFLSLRRTLPK